MKKTTLIASAAMIMAGAAIASANPFADVPYSHWAYDAINTMASRGVIQGFPDGTYKGNKNVTRYELAMITAKMIANIENGVGSVSKDDMKTLEKLTTEFADELALLGVKITALEDDMAVVKEDVAGLKKDVDGIKSYMKNGGMEKVKLSVDMLVRNFGSKIEVDGNDISKKHKTETVLRLQMDAQIDENITARARWNMIENQNGKNHEWNGANKNTGDVEIAYLQIKDMFGFGGDFKFGRDWYQHGHGFVMHNYADAISYTKRCGDVDLALNSFFFRQDPKDVENPNGTDNDTHQIWNINADYSYKNHDMYFGAYYGTAAYSDEDTTIIEFGSHGPISNNNEKVTYDVAAAYSVLKDGMINDDDGSLSDLKGWLGHVAVNYDSQKQLTAKVAYTFADDESFSALNVENSNRWCDGDETIFEDMFLFGMANNANTNMDFHNLNDIKVQLGYTLKNADKHSFRLAYDNIQNKEDNSDNTFTMADGRLGAYTNDLKSNIITFEYTYKLAENTRIRLGYQNSKTEADQQPDIKTNLYYTEIYSRF